MIRWGGAGDPARCLSASRRARAGDWLACRVTPVRALMVSIPSLYFVVFGAFLLRKGDCDWDQQLTFHRIALWNFEMSGLAKGWNPLMAGGMSLAGDPQVGVLSLSMLLSHLVPPAAAIKITCLLFLVVAGLGTYALSRRFGLDRETAWLAAALFAGNGFILSRFARGHTDFLGSLCLPLWMCGTLAALRGPGEPASRALRRLLRLVLLFGTLLVLSTDGAPIAFLLTLTWVGLDALVLGWQERTLRPALLLLGAITVAIALDAVYFLPMISNAFVFPRERPGIFINPLVFLFFLLVPVRGRLLPAPVNGHELSVYIGPVLAYLMIRYRRFVREAIPRDPAFRLALISVVVLALGLGSWRAIAAWLPPGPFDVLRLLPGFRAIGVPARFAGYLALPFALAGAIAVRAFERRALPQPHRKAVWAGLFLFTVGFELFTLPQPFLSASGRIALPAIAVAARIDTIDNVLDRMGSQAATILPTRGLIHAYNDHEYVHGDIAPTAELVRWARTPTASSPVSARWDGWSDIVLGVPASPEPTTIVLNQNFHPLWQSSLGTVSSHGPGNIRVELPPVPRPAEVRLRFRDPASEVGRRVTIYAIPIVTLLLVVLWSGAIVRIARRRRSTTLDPARGAEGGSRRQLNG